MKPFKPEPKKKPEGIHVNMRFTHEEYLRIRSLATENRVSIRQFCKQAVIYAIGNMAAKRSG